MERQSAMPHQDFTTFTKKQRRNLLDSRDWFIDVEGHFKLTARYSQVIFKTLKHGKIYGLTVDEKDRTPKTEKNTLTLRHYLAKMPERKYITCFENGRYQKGTERGQDSVKL